MAAAEYALMEDGAANSLTLDNSEMVYGLEGVPAGTALTVDNGTTVDLEGQAVNVSLGTVTLANGTITDGPATDAITATSYLLENGTIDVGLAGGLLTFSGNGYVSLTGNDSYTGGTTIGTTTGDTGTLTVAPVPWAAGPSSSSAIARSRRWAT